MAPAPGARIRNAVSPDKTVAINRAAGAVEKPVWSCFNSGMGTWVLVAAFGESQSTQNVPEHPAGNCAPTARG
jgi:hypothetical protein